MDGRKILELQQEAEDARKRCQEEKKALKTKLDDATRAKEALETEVQELEQDDVERSSKLEATQKELDNANRELEHLQEKAKKAAEACEKEKKQLSGQLEDERDRFQKEKGALIGQRNALRKQIISEEELRQKAEGDLEVAQTQKRCLQEELVKRYEEEMTALRRQIDQTTEDYTELEESELEHTLAFTKLVRDYDESIEEIASLQKDIRRTQEGVRSMKTERTASINAARNLVEALRPLIEQSHADHQAAFQAFSDAIPKTETDARKSNTQIGVRGASDTGYDGDDEGKVDDSAFA
jgi:chromosome segregation ATPase